MSDHSCHDCEGRVTRSASAKRSLGMKAKEKKHVFVLPKPQPLRRIVTNPAYPRHKKVNIAPILFLLVLAGKSMEVSSTLVQMFRFSLAK